MGFFSSIGNFVKANVGGLLSAGGDVLGGILGSNSQQSINDANLAFSREQFEYQKAYARNRLQWQVEDAKKAGLHPMVAAGISPTSFSPVSVSQSPLDTDWVGEAGQSLAYASAKAKDRKQQAEAFQFTKDLHQAQLDGVYLDNELKVMQILSQLSVLSQTGPSAPSLSHFGVIPGQDDSIVFQPSEVFRSVRPGVQSGNPNSVQWFVQPDKSVVRGMSEQYKSMAEDDTLSTLGWHYDNNFIPFASRYGYPSGANPSTFAPPLEYLPKGAVGWKPSGVNRFVPVYDYSDRSAYYGPLE